MRRIPLVPTLVVLIAAGIMIRLGFWQLDRLHQKEAALASYSAAESNPDVASLRRFDAQEIAALGFRKVSLRCDRAGPEQMVAGRGAGGETGWAHLAVCEIGGADKVLRYPLVLGWSKDMKAASWSGGAVTGVLVPGPKGGAALPEKSAAADNLDFHVVADPALAGLAPNARPDPNDIPNNHLSYAVQWFLFAATALVIYAIALRKRLRQQ